MNPYSRNVGIDCPTNLFPEQEVEVYRLTQAINQARTVKEKAPWAQELIETVNVLLDCEHYDGKNLNCHLCHNFSELRREVFTLVVSLGRL